MDTVVDLKNVQRRSLKLNSLADLDAELARIEQAHRQGRLQRLGNWTPGQILGHLAAWLEFGWRGYPPVLNPPLPIRVLLRLTKRRFLSRPLPAGFRIPKVEGGTVGTEPLEFDEGMARLRQALERLRRGEAPPHPSPVFGTMSHAEAVQANLRHSELHLSYLDY
jgi:hypothetical protein